MGGSSGSTMLRQHPDAAGRLPPSGQWASWLSGAWSPTALLAAAAAPAVGAAALVRGRALCSFSPRPSSACPFLR
jgi:hypothetical protein